MAVGLPIELYRRNTQVPALRATAEEVERLEEQLILLLLIVELGGNHSDHVSEQAARQRDQSRNHRCLGRSDCGHVDHSLVERPNENKMSDGGRERASLGVGWWKSSQKWSAQRSAVRSIAWLGSFDLEQVDRHVRSKRKRRLSCHRQTASSFFLQWGWCRPQDDYGIRA